jgi:hypothetical protein
MKRAGLQNSKRVFTAFALFVGLMVSIPVPMAQATNDVQAPCVIGSSATCPAQSPQEIYNLYGTTTNGTYWLNVNGTATQTYLVLDTAYPDGGMWFLGMKGAKAGTAFTYSANYWTDQTTTLTPDYNNDVATEAKYGAFNYIPVTKLVAVFKDRDSNGFNTSGSGDLGTNSFGGHTWMETITATTMYSRFSTNSNLVDGAVSGLRYTTYRETNSSSGKLVFPYQTGWARYGFNNTTAYNYRWGMTFNNESNYGSNDSGSGIGMSDFSAKAQLSYTDGLSYAPNGSSGALNGSTMNYSSGFQIWGKMAAPSLATPGALSITNQGAGTVQLSFGASASATEYAIQYKTAGSSWNTGTTVRLINPGASPSATLTGLSSGSYDFRVFARAANDSSAGNSYLLAQAIDATAPTVSSISISSSSGADSIYGAGEVITATINWSEAVTVTGSPRIPLQGLTSKYLTYASGSGSTSTTFTYTVVNGDLDRDGFAITADSLALNGGTIKDSALNTATLSHSAILASLTNQVDGTPPVANTPQTSSDGSSITLTFDETLSATGPAVSAISILVNGNTDTVTSTSITGKTIRFFLTFQIISSATITFTYTDPSAGNDSSALQDEAGNDAPTISAVAVTNISTTTSNTSASIALNPASTTAVYRAVTTIRVSTNTAGRVDFFQAGKIIVNCRNVATSGNIASCSWKPMVHAYITLTARFRPSGTGYQVTNTSPLQLFVVGRSGNR